MGELAVVAWLQPCLIAGDFNVEPNKIPCLAKGISAGLWVDLEASWAVASGRDPAVTCKRTWDSDSGNKRDFQIGCPLCAAAVLSCEVVNDRWVQPHLAVRTWFAAERWSDQVTQPRRFAPLWPAFWVPSVDRSRGLLSLLRFGGSGRFMMIVLVGLVLMMLVVLMTLLLLKTFLVLGLLGLLLLKERWLMLSV